MLNVPLVELESTLIRQVGLHASRATLADMLTKLGSSIAIFVALGTCLDELPKDSWI